ncbi:unnamed protein product [Calypogeia fissa]
MSSGFATCALCLRGLSGATEEERRGLQRRLGEARDVFIGIECQIHEIQYRGTQLRKDPVSYLSWRFHLDQGIGLVPWGRQGSEM